MLSCDDSCAAGLDSASGLVSAGFSAAAAGFLAGAALGASDCCAAAGTAPAPKNTDAAKARTKTKTANDNRSVGFMVVPREIQRDWICTKKAKAIVHPRDGGVGAGSA